MFLLLVYQQAVGQQGLNHQIYVGFEVWLALSARPQRHIENDVASPLVSQLELRIVILGRKASTFLNMSSVRLPLLKYSEGSPTIKSAGLTCPMFLTTCQISSSV